MTLDEFEILAVHAFMSGSRTRVFLAAMLAATQLPFDSDFLRGAIVGCVCSDRRPLHSFHDEKN